MRDKKGFTLIELLVAMAIIAILIGMAVFGVSQGLLASRDTQRRSLVDEIQKGIVVYQGRYYNTPDSITLEDPVDGDTNILIGQGSKQITISFGYNVYMAGSKDQDFEPDEAYICFVKNTSEAGYALGVKLEASGGDAWFYKTTDECF